MVCFCLVGKQRIPSLTVFEESVLIFHLEPSGYFYIETRATFSLMATIQTPLGVGSEWEACRDTLANSLFP